VTDDQCENPYTYRGPWRTGEQRKLALMVFQHRGYTTGMQLWHAPANGGARKITADDVNWETM
jgi:hypothetical protein